MGNDLSCINTKEDAGMSRLKLQAVGANSNQISDAELAGMMDNNPMNALKQKVGLTFRCSDLPNLDRNSKTDAFCVLWDISGRQKRKIGETEVVADNLNPEFVTEMNVEYYFEQQ